MKLDSDFQTSDASCRRFDLSPPSEVSEIDFWTLTWDGQSIGNLPEADLLGLVASVFGGGSLQHFPKLESLRIPSRPLKDAGVSRWPKDFFCSKSLRSLTIGGKAPALKTLAGLTKLEALALPESKVTKLPDDIGSCRYLHHLCVYNKLEIIPPSIGDLEGLRSVDFRTNKLEELPISFWSLPSLEEVNLSDNPLRCLPFDSLRLPNIKRLDVSRTPFGIYRNNIEKLANVLPGCEISGGAAGGYYAEDRVVYLHCTKKHYNSNGETRSPY